MGDNSIKKVLKLAIIALTKKYVKQEGPEFVFDNKTFIVNEHKYSIIIESKEYF